DISGPDRSHRRRRTPAVAGAVRAKSPRAVQPDPRYAQDAGTRLCPPATSVTVWAVSAELPASGPMLSAEPGRPSRLWMTGYRRSKESRDGRSRVAQLPADDHVRDQAGGSRGPGADLCC